MMHKRTTIIRTIFLFSFLAWGACKSDVLRGVVPDLSEPNCEESCSPCASCTEDERCVEDICVSTPPALTDDVPPSVVSVSPLGNAVDAHQGLQIEFSEAMDHTMGAHAVVLRYGGPAGEVVALKAGTWSANNVFLHLEPVQALASAQLYHAEVGVETLKDVTGNALGAPYYFEFITRSTTSLRDIETSWDSGSYAESKQGFELAVTLEAGLSTGDNINIEFPIGVRLSDAHLNHPGFDLSVDGQRLGLELLGAALGQATRLVFIFENIEQMRVGEPAVVEKSLRLWSTRDAVPVLHPYLALPTQLSYLGEEVYSHVEGQSVSFRLNFRIKNPIDDEELLWARWPSDFGFETTEVGGDVRVESFDSGHYTLRWEGGSQPAGALLSLNFLPKNTETATLAQAGHYAVELSTERDAAPASAFVTVRPIPIYVNNGKDSNGQSVPLGCSGECVDVASPGLGCGCGPMFNLDRALASAEPGNRIQIAPGKYVEGNGLRSDGAYPMSFPEDVHFRGTGDGPRDVLIAAHDMENPGEAAFIELSASPAFGRASRLENLVLRAQSNADSPMGNLVSCTLGNAELLNVVFEGTGANAALSSNEIEGFFASSCDVVIQDSVFDGFRHPQPGASSTLSGVYLVSPDQFLIERTAFLDNSTGLRIYGRAGDDAAGTVRDSDFCGNQYIGLLDFYYSPSTSGLCPALSVENSRFSDVSVYASQHCSLGPNYLPISTGGCGTSSGILKIRGSVIENSTGAGISVSRTSLDMGTDSDPGANIIADNALTGVCMGPHLDVDGATVFAAGNSWNNNGELPEQSEYLGCNNATPGDFGFAASSVESAVRFCHQGTPGGCTRPSLSPQDEGDKK